MSKPRKKPLGEHNIIGARVVEVRQQNGWKQHELMAMLQSKGMDISEFGMSRLEGQTRVVADYELPMLCEVLGVEIAWLLGMTQSAQCEKHSES